MAAVLVALVVLGVIVAVGFLGWSRTIDDRRSTRLALNDLIDLRLALSDEETGVRGFVLAGDQQFLEPYQDGLTREMAAMEALRSNHVDIDGVDARLDEVAALATRWRTDAAEPAIADRRERATVDESLVELGRVRFEALRTALDSLQADVADAAARADDEVAVVQRTAFVAIGMLLLMVLLATFVVRAKYRRWVGGPLAEISSVARGISHGDEVVMPAFEASELADVGAAVDVLQRSLSAERDRAVRAYETLEQSAVLALHVRSELAVAEESMDLDGWQVASASRAARGIIAGDCHDVGFVNTELMYLLLIDVTGHGPVAALSALKSKALLRSALKAKVTPGAAMGWLAQQGIENAGDGELEMLTAFAATLHLGTGEIEYANAGHPPGLVLVDGGLTELGATGALIGAFPTTWSTARAVLPEGGALLLYTDGLTEAAGADRSRLGEERLKEHLVDVGASGAGARVIVASALQLVDSFTTQRPDDDLSIIAVVRDERAVDGVGRSAVHDAVHDAALG